MSHQDSIRLLTDYESLCRASLDSLAASADVVKIARPGKWSGAGAHGVYGPIITLAMSAFDPWSPRRGEGGLLERLAEATDALEAFQHDDGTIDLPLCNFHSPPDTAFMVEELAVLCSVLGRVAPPSPPCDELLERLAGVIRRACDGMVGAGVHTPNHRWKMASALTLADKLFPREAWRAEAQAYLDEGVDIDEDGEYAERSTGGYNHVCDRAMILIGRALGRGEYLDYADRNLRHMLYLIHPDGTMVTSYSRRQDRNKTVGIERYMKLYWYRAMTAGDGQFLSAAGMGLERLVCFETPTLASRRGLSASPPSPASRPIAPRGSGGLGAFALWLRYFDDAAGRAAPEPEPLPTDYEQRFAGVGVLRRRAGDLSLTIMTGSDDLLALRWGEGPEVGLRIAAGFAPDGQFVAEEIEGSSDRYTLRSHHQCVYFGPGPDRLPAVDYRTRPAFKRRVHVAAELTMTLQIVRDGDRVELRLSTDGCPGVPVEMAMQLRGAEAVECDGQLEDDAAMRKRFLNAGRLTVTGPTHVLEIAPGAGEHDATELRGVHGSAGRDAVCVRLVTPIDQTLTIAARPR